MFRYALFFFLIAGPLFSSAQNLIISKLNDSSFVYTTFNTYQGDRIPANGLLKITQNSVVMIDTPWDTTQFQPLLDSIEIRFHKPVRLVIATHSHEDRTAGLAYYNKKNISTYTSKATYQLCEENHAPLASGTFLHDTTFTVDGTLVSTFFPGAGHTPDNILIWFPNDKVLFGGCFVKSTDATDLGNLNDANLGMWPFAVNLSRKTFKKAKYIIPGHGSWKSKKSLKHTRKLLVQKLKGNYKKAQKNRDK